uniref:Methyltransferase domain protein n=1 Tax=Pithovirus LCPAC001 TaxID=2506585 RepID=A0A481Z1Q4_9VIRU|nr:MAG: methyltransferase domain protein [Pithovirus LCPAC001]
MDKNKTFIDIGGWIGTTCIYASRLSKRVLTVEADTQSIKYLRKNCKNNARNIECINRAIYKTNGIDITFGKNKHLPNSKLNDSTSHIYLNKTNNGYTIKTIDLKTLFDDYNVNLKEISLIKVDIEGGEENILEDLYKASKRYGFYVFLSFHLSWWNDKNIDRFDFLSTEQKTKIKQNPFCSLLLKW